MRICLRDMAHSLWTCAGFRGCTISPNQYLRGFYRASIPSASIGNFEHTIISFSHLSSQFLPPSLLSSSSHVWMWELDHKEGWALKDWCFQTVVVEKTLESPLDCKEIKPVHPKGTQSWIFIGRTDAEAEALKLWLPDANSWLIRKDPDAGKDWGQEKKGMKEDEMVGWHHRCNGHETEQAPGDSEWQGGLVCCSPWDQSHTWWSDWTTATPSIPSITDSIWVSFLFTWNSEAVYCWLHRLLLNQREPCEPQTCKKKSFCIHKSIFESVATHHAGSFFSHKQKNPDLKAIKQ